MCRSPECICLDVYGTSGAEFRRRGRLSKGPPSLHALSSRTPFLCGSLMSASCIPRIRSRSGESTQTGYEGQMLLRDPCISPPILHKTRPARGSEYRDSVVACCYESSVRAAIQPEVHVPGGCMRTLQLKRRTSVSAAATTAMAVRGCPLRTHSASPPIFLSRRYYAA